MADANDQYARMARISYLSGHVGFQHAGDADWSAASVNMPLQVGDRIYTGEDGRAEIQFDDGSVCRLAEKTDIEFLTVNDDLIQMRLLVGLSSLVVNSGMNYEMDTPAAAFTVLQKGKYRFDVVESGDTDGIVRKGVLEASSNNFSRTVREDQLLHIPAGGQSDGAISSYRERDQWDEWNDRRDADTAFYVRSKHLPANVYIGARELDLYGRWIDSAYGPAWIPMHVSASWSPYWNGRWCYRPIWGWTWVSYDPWGWLPFHYGRWHYATTFGWCWIPGTSINFNFWSPGLVRFYYGPDWISWCPLGPGDYYNVNHYYYRASHYSHLNTMRLIQHRSPGNLFNRDTPGAFRTVKNDQFVRLTYEPGGANGIERNAVVDNPWKNGKMVDDGLNIRPTNRSYSPLPDNPAAKPVHELTRPVIVRSEPSAATDSGRNLIRITNRNAQSPREIRSDAPKALKENPNPSGAASVRRTGNDQGVAQNTRNKSAADSETENSVTGAQSSGQERNKAQNDTRIYRLPQRSQSGTKSEGTQRNPKSERIISPASPSETPDRQFSNGMRSSANNAGSAFSERNSTQTPPRVFSEPVQEQRQARTGSSKSSNGNRYAAPLNSGVQQYSSRSPSYNGAGQTSEAPSRNFNSSSGEVRSAGNAARSAAQKASSGAGAGHQKQR
ncbi:MAG: hypothetical protein H6Q04_411 [Acidobacteria bacterium]|nr:hypothetical protein [Acidobacteriota bacterium]